MNKYKCPFCKRRIKTFNALCSHIRTRHDRSLVVLREEEYSVYLELKSRKMNPCWPSTLRWGLEKSPGYKWSLQRCWAFLERVGYSLREGGFSLKELRVVRKSDGIIIVRVIE